MLRNIIRHRATLKHYIHSGRAIHTTMPSYNTLTQFPSPIKKVQILDSSDTYADADAPAPNYIDTMHVFNELRRLGFTEEQSDTILQLVKETLSHSVGKMEQKMLDSNELENELYLFEAAQSELKVEITTSREGDLHSLANEKSLLENLLNEEMDDLNKELIVSRNDSQVLINDQISENTLLQRTLKRRIQDLNNRISTEINGDIKSEIEGLRWHTTSRGLMAVLVLVFAIMSGVSISKKVNREYTPQEVILRTLEPEDTENDISSKEQKDEAAEKKS